MSTATQPLAVPRLGFAALAREYSVLVKARVTTLVMLTAWCGAYLAATKSGIPSLSQSMLVPSTMSHSSGRAFPLQSWLVPVLRSQSSGMLL